MKNTQHHPCPARAPGRFLTAGLSAAGLYAAVLPAAHAANRNWDGSDSQAWETATNWGENAVPAAGDVVFIATTGSLPNHPVISTGAQVVSEVWFGAFNGNPSRLDITGGSLTVSTRLVIGPDDASVVTLNQSGGAVSLTSGSNAFTLGRNGGDSTYNMSGGTLSSATWFNIGDSGAGGTSTFNLTSGTVNAATGAGAVNIGDQGGATGVLNVSGGAFNSTNTTANGGIVVGNHWTGTGTNTGTLTVSGTGLVNTGSSTAGNGLKLAAGSASVGTVNLDGGTLQAARVQKGAGTGTFHFNGGTLQATAANATFMSGLTNAYVKSGGAVIDTNGFAVTIGQTLLTDPVSTGGGLTKAGAGTLTLSGASTYTGATTIDAGTLVLGPSASLSSASYSIANGATFDVSALAVFDLSGKASTIGLDGSTAGFFNAGSCVLTLGNSLSLSFSTASLVAGTNYNLFDHGSHIGDFGDVSLAGSLTGSLTRSGEIWSGVSGGFVFSFNEADGVLAISAVPEPAAFAAFAGLAGLGVTLVRRRRSLG